MLTITYNPEVQHDAELVRAEVWMDADGPGFVVTLVAVLVSGMRGRGMRLLAGTVAGCPDQPSAMDAAERMLRNSKLGQAFVSYHWGRPALVPVQASPCPVCRRVA